MSSKIIKIKCKNCSKIFEDYVSNKRKFCNRKCYLTSSEHIELIRKVNSKKMKGNIPWNKGIPWDEKIKKKISNKNKGKIPWNKGRKFPEYSGKNHFNWKGGKSTNNEIARTNPEYSEWHKKVLARDHYVCQKCDIKGGKIIAHHIENFSNKKELRYEVSNGITFCKECHDLFHKIYSRFNNNLEQVLKFIYKE